MSIIHIYLQGHVHYTCIPWTKKPLFHTDSGDIRKPGRTPTNPHRGPRSTTKVKPKPYTVRYLTLEEARALKEKAEDRTAEEQTPTVDRTNGRPTEEMSDTEDNGGTTKGRETTVTENETKDPKEPRPEEPDNQPGQPVQGRPSRT